MLSVAGIILVPALITATTPFTVDCNSFSRPSGYTINNTCTPEGDWSAVWNRQLPDFYQDMKFGIFVHWGVFSVPAYGNEWYWHNAACGDEKVKAFQDKNFGPGWQYPDFAPMFKAELFDADDWVDTFLSAGAQYVLPVAKHHDGFALWNASDTSPGWNAVEVGPKRDVLTELYDSCQKKGLSFGIYYSQGEWFDVDMVQDARNNFTTTEFIKKKVIPQRLDLVTRYWGNLDWLDYLYTKSPIAPHVVCYSFSSPGAIHLTP
eukprot:gene1000-2610_t